MSNNGVICRDKYFNYGSYLRSRGFDKELCNMVKMIESSQTTSGPITYNGEGGITINGTTTIQNCKDTSNAFYSGILKVTGGDDITMPTNFSISANHGFNLIGPIYQNYGSDVSYNVSGTTYHGNVFSSNNHIFKDHDVSTNVIVYGKTSTDILSPNKQEVYGISYESPSLSRQSYIFGSGFALGDISGQLIPAPINNLKYGSQFLTSKPEQLKINAMSNVNLLRLSGTSPNQYMILDISNNENDVINSVFCFNANITFTDSIERIVQTVLFLHPGDPMEINQTSGAGFWPDVNNGDIIIDTRSLGDPPGSIPHNTASYGELQVFNGDVIPNSDNNNHFALKYYTPHIAISYKRRNESVILHRGNISMKQILFK